MVVGKLSILLAANPVLADNIQEPRFYSYSGSHWANRLVDMSFGWFKTLDDIQKATYHQSITHAVMFAENGQRVSWYERDASGVSMPAMTWPTSDGYCRRIHIQVIAYNIEKTMTATACYSDIDNRWRWI